MAVFWLVGGVFSVGYGLFEILAPWIAIRWQVRSTAKHRDDFRGDVGRTFQRWTGSDPEAEPWNDARVRRNVRLIGGFLVVCGGAFIAVGISMLGQA